MLSHLSEMNKQSLVSEAAGVCGTCPSREACARISSNIKELQQTVSQSAKLRRDYLSIKTHLERAGYHYPNVMRKDECWFMGKKGVVNYYDISLDRLRSSQTKGFGVPKRA